MSWRVFPVRQSHLEEEEAKTKPKIKKDQKKFHSGLHSGFPLTPPPSSSSSSSSSLPHFQSMHFPILTTVMVPLHPCPSLVPSNIHPPLTVLFRRRHNNHGIFCFPE